MATEEFRVSGVIRTSPNRVYDSWLDERQHTAFTGARATIAPWVGGRHTALDGACSGTLVRFDTGRSILMTWRGSDFPAEAPDSTVEVQFEPIAGGTKLTVIHAGVPSGLAARYKEIWRDHYLEPLKKFMGKPGAMQEALRAAARAGKMPIPGVTSATPATARHIGVPAPALIPKGPPAEATDEGRDKDEDDNEDEEQELDSERPARRERPTKAASTAPPPKASAKSASKAEGKTDAKKAIARSKATPPRPPSVRPKATTAGKTKSTRPPPKKKSAAKRR